MRILNENVSRNIMNKLNEAADSVDAIESFISKEGQLNYGVKSVTGKDNKLLVKTDNGDYWFVIDGDNIKISMAETHAEPILRSRRGKRSVPKISWEVSGVFSNPIQAAKEALESLEPKVED